VPRRSSITGSELFILDHSGDECEAARRLHDGCRQSKSIDIATEYFDIGALPARRFTDTPVAVLQAWYEAH
jgi:hypothetical protein